MIPEFLGSEHSLVLLRKKLLMKNHVILFSLLNTKKITFPHEFIFIFIPNFFVAILSKIVVKSVVFEEKIQRTLAIYGVVYRKWGFKSYAHYDHFVFWKRQWYEGGWRLELETGTIPCSQMCYHLQDGSRHQSKTAVNDNKTTIDKDELSELFRSKNDELLKVSSLSRNLRNNM